MIKGTGMPVFSGVAMPGLSWSEGTAEKGESAFVVDYYTNMLTFVWAEDGCSMNFMDAMDMHFIPKQEFLI